MPTLPPNGQAVPVSTLLERAEGDATPEAVGRAVKFNPFTSLGQSGEQRTGTYRSIVDADPLLQLRDGPTRIKAMREVSLNDPIMFAFTLAVTLLCRRAPWRVEPFSDTAEHRKQAEHVESCLDDMATPWSTVVSHALTSVWAGFSLLEITHKYRKGASKNPLKRSTHKDGMVGWATIAPRAPQTIWQWVYDLDGNLRAARQLGPPLWKETVISLEKCLHVVPLPDFGSPWGIPLMRGAYVPYFFLKRLREVEGIGIERDLNGLPYMKVPGQIMSDDATEAEKATYAAANSLVRNIRRDAQEGVTLPSDRDPDNGELLYELSLLASGSSRAINIRETITAWEQRMATSVLADFMMLGQGEGAGGSFALSEDKTTLFRVALEALLQTVADETNRKAIPLLYDLNGWDSAECCHVEHGAVAERDATVVVDALQKLAGSGAPIWPNDDLFKWCIEDILRGPKITDEQMEMMAAQQQVNQMAMLGLDPAVELGLADEPQPQPGAPGQPGTPTEGPGEAVGQPQPPSPQPGQPPARPAATPPGRPPLRVVKRHRVLDVVRRPAA